MADDELPFHNPVRSGLQIILPEPPPVTLHRPIVPLLASRILRAGDLIDKNHGTIGRERRKARRKPSSKHAKRCIQCPRAPRCGALYSIHLVSGENMATGVIHHGSSRLDNLFFPGVAVLILATVFLGFARTYYLAVVFRAPLPNLLIHIHGAFVRLRFGVSDRHSRPYDCHG